MGRCWVRFAPAGEAVEVDAGTTILDAARLAGVVLSAPCGGAGRCGRCKVSVQGGPVEQVVTFNLSAVEAERGLVLACSARVMGDVTVSVSAEAPAPAPPPEEVAPEGETWPLDSPLLKLDLELVPPGFADNTSDLARLRDAIARAGGPSPVTVELLTLRDLGRTLRSADWRVTAVLDSADSPAQLVNLQPVGSRTPLLGVAVDVGTTTVEAKLIDLGTGAVLETALDYNGQVACGEDVISRIIYAQRADGLDHLQRLVVQTINSQLQHMCDRQGVSYEAVREVYCAGNTTMTHLLLGVDPKTIREEPYISTFSCPPTVSAGDLGLAVHPLARVRCFPAVGSYVGGDIVAGVLSAGLAESEKLALFVDVGTNGEIVLGNSDWLVACACSAGPAFEGAGVRCGMRAEQGAIEELWIDGHSGEVSYEVLGGVAARGVCGSGLLSALAEMLLTGVIDKGGRIRQGNGNRRARLGENGPEYVLAFAGDAGATQDIVLTEADISNLIRAKAAVFAGISVLANSVGVDLTAIERVFIAGGFGRHISIAKAVQIGMFPDLPRERFRYLGNTSLRGACAALCDRASRAKARELAAKMTYVELSADNHFMDEYTSALFLPHTNLAAFPSVAPLLPVRAGA